MTTHLKNMLKNACGYTGNDEVVVRDIKKKRAQITTDFDAELFLSAESTSLAVSYELPDGNVIHMDTDVRRFYSNPPYLHTNRRRHMVKPLVSTSTSTKRSCLAIWIRARA